MHPSVPYALAWGNSILAAGNDNRVVFYKPENGREVGAFDYSADEEVRDLNTNLTLTLQPFLIT